MQHPGRTILLVDDTAAVRRALRNLFESAGFICAESENGSQAIEMAEQLQPDLIVLDFSMPVMNGLEAVPLFKKKSPNIPIIMFTMFASEEFARLAIAAGVNEVISKERASSQLIPRVESLLKSLPARA